MALVTTNQFGPLVPQLSLAGTGFAQGQQIGAGFQQQRLRQQETQQSAQLDQFSRQAIGGDQGALSEIAAIAPDRAEKIRAHLASLDDATRAEGLRVTEVVTRGALDALSLPPNRRRSFVEQKRDEARAQGVDTSRLDKALEGTDAQLNQLLIFQAREGQTIAQLAKEQFPGRAPTGRPFAALGPEGESVFVERGPGGELRQIEGFKPPVKTGEIIESLPGGGFRITRGTTAPDAGLSRKTVSDLEDKIVTNEENLLSLDRISEQFQPEFLTFKGGLIAKVSSLKSKLGKNLTDEEIGFLKSRRKFTQNINQFFNKYKKEITGAAASIQEMAGLKDSMFNEDLSPVEFEASFNEFQDAVKRINRLQRKILREGISKSFGDDMDDLFTSGLDDNIEARGAELRASGLDDNQILQMLEQEGYTKQVR